MSLLLGLGTLGFLLLLLLAKSLTVLELRARESEYRHNTVQISDLEQDLDTSRRKYLIAIKAEGVAKHRLSQAKTKLASLKQHADALRKTAAQSVARKEKEQEQRLEGIVMHALGGTSVRRDSQFKRVMKVITRLVDAEKGSDNDQIIAAIEEKIRQMGRKGLLKAAEQGGGVEVEEVEGEKGEAETQVESEAEEQTQVADTPDQPTKERSPTSRKDLIRDALVKKR
jgi:hypothetical protein